jgi:hypothetical protein
MSNNRIEKKISFKKKKHQRKKPELTRQTCHARYEIGIKRFNFKKKHIKKPKLNH